MGSKRYIFFVSLALWFASAAATSGISFADTKAKSSEVESSFMCKRMRDAKLAALKKSLVTDCDLNKPFSIGETDIGVNSAYTFCCHSAN